MAIESNGRGLGPQLRVRQQTHSRAVYSVAVAGLDPARDLSAGDRPTLSPVMNLTVTSTTKGTRSHPLDRDGVLRGRVPRQGLCAGVLRAPQEGERERGQGVGPGRGGAAIPE